MAISVLRAGNFKGIGDITNIDLKPITVFIGPNSSGKSTCIHALACLGQTIKITSNPSHLVLDDEYADVHLGRFREVAHTRSSKDPIVLGFTLDDLTVPLFTDRGKGKPPSLKTKKEKAEFDYHFKCKGLTQEPYLHRASMIIGEDQFDITRKGGHHFITNVNADKSIKCRLDPSLRIDIANTLTTASQLKRMSHFMIPFYTQDQVVAEMTKILYLGPFRQSPQRLYPTRGGNPREVGPMGESTVAMLANEALQSRTRTHLKQVSTWLGSLGLANGMSIKRVGQSDLFNIAMEIEKGNKVPLADLGYGLSQVLPVLTQCSFAPEDSTLLFEQPEIHLHTIAARSLAGVFIETASVKKCRLLLETHSPDLFKEFLCRIRGGEWKLDDFVAYRVTRESGESAIHKIDIDPDDCDVYENWERGLSLP